jgi:hypothetical protein
MPERVVGGGRGDLSLNFAGGGSMSPAVRQTIYTRIVSFAVLVVIALAVITTAVGLRPA